MYPHDKVYVTRSQRGEQDTYQDEEGETHKKQEKYTKVHKGAYVVQHILSPLINALAFLVFYCFAKEWVHSHRNQQRAYG